MDECAKHFPKEDEDQYGDEVIKFSLIGRPNVGKSSLVNAFLGQDRVIVSNIAGTTRDAIDTPYEYDGQEYVIIDTAGMRKKGKYTKRQRNTLYCVRYVQLNALMLF